MLHRVSVDGTETLLKKHEQALHIVAVRVGTYLLKYALYSMAVGTHIVVIFPCTGTNLINGNGIHDIVAFNF